MESAIRPTAVPQSILWTARVLRALVVLFLLFDAAGHLLMPPPVVEAFTRLGLPLGFGPALGVLKLVLLAVYLTPRASALGAVLITGYLGGAIAINLRAGSPPFETLFPIIVAVIVWAPLYLTDARVKNLFSLQKDR